MHTHYDSLEKNPANYVALSPLSFIKRAADIYTDRIAVIAGDIQYTWQQVYDRSRRLASALSNNGIQLGDTVSVISPNNPALFEAHFGIPMCGAVINTINTRLEPETIAYILEDAETKILIVDSSLEASVTDAIQRLEQAPKVIWINADKHQQDDYEAFIESGDAEFPWETPVDEWQALSLNYTSGTSGRPKGVVYHHRGSYLMSLGTIAAWHLPPHPVYLFTVPIFHCNGWGHAWTMALAGGTVICPPTLTAADIFNCIDQHKVTHFGGAPVVLSMLINASDSEKRKSRHPVQVMTAGAPPPAAVLEQTRELGFEVIQVYGLTETFGHVTHCLWREDWSELSFSEQADLQSRQGVAFPITEDAIVVDMESGDLVPRDGKTPGEILIRGNTVMKGYLKSADATKSAFKDGYFHSGDVAVWWENGYIQIMDRLKDVIISGGENVSSVEVENVLHRHPAVALAAVVAMPHEKWGEVPCAYVSLKPGQEVNEAQVIAFCKSQLAGFKTPKSVVFGPLPQTATGKIQKYVLRDRIKQRTEKP